MASEERRLAAIVVADVVGYSQMMAEDEDGTLAALRAHRTAIDPVILNHGGRIVKGTGDGLIVEFGSATAALEAAVGVQALMGDRNREIPESRRMSFRIEVNLGDVVVDETGDVFGDGVNVAARVEATADPGGVSATASVREAVRDKLAFGFVDDGEHELKNIPTPIRLWKLGPASEPVAKPTTMPQRRLATVAVLPLENRSGDVDQEYFADGLTEDLLTALSYDRDLAVVARNSVFAYKGRNANVRTIARELDATHVVEGSVRRTGAASVSPPGWSTQRPAITSGPSATTATSATSSRFRTSSSKRSSRISARRSENRQRAGRARVRSMPGTSRSEDSSISTRTRPRASFGPSSCSTRRAGSSPTSSPPSPEPPWRGCSSPTQAGGARTSTHGSAAQKKPKRLIGSSAHRLDRNDYAALGALSVVRSTTGRPDDRARLARRMIERNPYAPLGSHMLGNNLDKAGDHDASIVPLSQAWRLGRHDPLRFDIANDLAHSHDMAGWYEPAISWGLQSLSSKDDYLLAHIVLAAAYGRLGRTEGARPHVEAVLASRPGFSSGKHWSRLAYVRDEDRDHLVDGLRKAGLPD